MFFNNNAKNEKNRKILRFTQQELELFLYAIEHNNGIISPIPDGFLGVNIGCMKSLEEYNKKYEDASKLVGSIYETGVLSSSEDCSRIHVDFTVYCLFHKLGRGKFLKKFVEVVDS